MPVSPKLAMRLALELRGLYEAATNQLIRAIAVQVGRGAQDATWQDRKLEAITLLMHDVDRTIDDLRREVPGAVERALGYAYRRGSAVASVEAEAAGITGSFGFMPDEEALTRLLSEAMRPHEEVILGIRRSVQDVYDQALKRAAGVVLTGAGTRVDAARSALSLLADRGITGFTDRSGRKWDMASYAEMVTRTSSGHAAIEGHMDRLTGLGMDTVYVSDSPEECDLCFIPGTTVEGPVPTGATRTEYSGDVVRITTASGNDLTGTPRHPVLTARGWVRLKDLHPGDQVVSHRREEGYPGVVPNDVQMPARIEEVAESGLPVLFAGPARRDLNENVTYCEVSGPALDLHLAAKVDPALSQPLTDHDLIGRVGSSLGGFGLSGSDLHGLGSGYASVGLMHGVEHGGAIFGGSVSPSFSHRLGDHGGSLLVREFGHVPDDAVRAGSSLDASATEVVSNTSATDPECGTEFLGAFSGDVPLDKLSGVGGRELHGKGSPANIESTISENSFESGLADLEGGHELLRRLSGSVFLDEVVDVTVSKYSGHVWDLSTAPRWFVANSIVVHNCRPFEGKVLSISGNTTGRLSDGTEVLCSVREARQRGLWHPSCSHSSSLFLPGITEPPTDTEDADDYELRQRQRAYERRIRKWKRRVEIEEAVVGKNDPHAKQARRKLRDVQAEFKNWRTQHDRRAVTQRTNLRVR